MPADPEGHNLRDAAGLPETFFTSGATCSRCELKAGETLLVHGGAGGIGTTAIQLASFRRESHRH